MKRNLFLIGLLCIVVGGGCLLFAYSHSVSVSDTGITTDVGLESTNATSTVSEIVGTTTEPINFEIATTLAEQEQGLGGRATIPDNFALLFVFPEDSLIGFWMKDMLTPIDMIWLTDNGTISGIEEDVLPSSYPDVFYPPIPTRYVLETRVGLAKEKGWTIGTTLALPLPY